MNSGGVVSLPLPGGEVWADAPLIFNFQGMTDCEQIAKYRVTALLLFATSEEVKYSVGGYKCTTITIFPPGNEPEQCSRQGGSGGWGSGWLDTWNSWQRSLGDCRGVQRPFPKLTLRQVLDYGGGALRLLRWSP